MLCVCVKMTPLGRGVIILTIQGRVMFLSSILCFIIMRAGGNDSSECVAATSWGAAKERRRK